MPAWVRNPFSRRTSTQTLRITNGDKSNTSDKFTLPTSTKEVEEQSTMPKRLPAPGADADEVRYFLYHLLTYKGNKIARKWPQWILETCAYWAGTGAELRAWKQDFQLLVPKSAGHAELDKASTYTDSPSGDCRLLIGNVIERTVKKMLNEEGNATMEHQEWIAKEMGSGRPQSSYGKPPTFLNTTGYSTHVDPQDYPDMSGSASFLSLPEPDPFHSHYNNTVYRPPSRSSHHVPVMRESVLVHAGSSYEPSNFSPTSSGASRFTNSTANTTPPASVEEMKAHSGGPRRYGSRSQPLHPSFELTQQNLQNRDGSRTLETQSLASRHTSSDLGSCRSTLRPSRSQAHFSSDYRQMGPSGNVRVQTPYTEVGMNQPVWEEEIPRSCSTSTVSMQDAPINTSHSLRGLQFAKQLQRQKSMASVRSRASHMNLSANSTPNTARRPPVGMGSLNYPQPNVSHARNRSGSSITPSVASSQPRQVASSIINEFSIHTTRDRPQVSARPQIPVLSSFTSTDRSPATAGVDQLALQQGAYHYMRVTDPAEAYKIALKERQSIQALRQEAIEAQGPTMRAMNPLTRMPSMTLFEVLEAKEVLQAKPKPTRY